MIAGTLLTVFIDKSRIVEEGNYHKFTKCQDSQHFSKMLLDTGDRELVEVSIVLLITRGRVPANLRMQASPTDRIWGIGFGAADALENRSNWGENRLGEAISRVRDRLREEGR